MLDHYQPEFVTNVDALTYAGNPDNLAGVAEQYSDRYEFCRADIADREAVEEIHGPDKYFAVINFAAETHVDRSISSPGNFIHTNVVGTEVLLESARRNGVKRFVQISTTRSTVRSARKGPLPKSRPSTPARPTPPARPGPTCSPSRPTRPLARRSSSPAARITTAPTSSRRNSSR